MLNWLFKRDQLNEAHQQREEGRALLKRLSQNHTFIEVTPEASDTGYRSLILAVEEDSILLDELFPGADNLKLSPGRRFDIDCREGGYNISFSAVLLSEEQNDDMPVYRLTVPDYVEHHQRRAAFRVKVPAASRMTVMLSGFGGAAVSGVIVDISSNGVRVNVGGLHPEELDAGTLVSDARFTLQDERIKCQLQICNSNFIRRPYAHTQLGCELRNVDTATQARLDRYIAGLQREQRRVLYQQDIDHE
ncbi:flagellar brake protein [Aestuariirhabdus sp. Z084]|uniref:flagellar brake protein n=1 Tax=Aestuariirhabdus haliotis TaxID=2918751 RepID=UPI00201B4265|nr:flagellar brake protein [Aestuariirhabdus haliotis]MCL6414394.1 flagellar brake protein [Aestuariirhabdus haliotis]MCL6418326.1 flagellar brake protein [Aestuariirhabdus haliotis]